MLKYLVIYEKTDTGCNAYIRESPGFVRTGKLWKPERHRRSSKTYHHTQIPVPHLQLIVTSKKMRRTK